VSPDLKCPSVQVWQFSPKPAISGLRLVAISYLTSITLLDDNDTSPETYPSLFLNNLRTEKPARTSKSSFFSFSRRSLPPLPLRILVSDAASR
jgi:hypothetical protein